MTLVDTAPAPAMPAPITPTPTASEAAPAIASIRVGAVALIATPPVVAVRFALAT